MARYVHDKVGTHFQTRFDQLVTRVRYARRHGLDDSVACDCLLEEAEYWEKRGYDCLAARALDVVSE